MKLLKKFSVLITFGALSLYGSSACAASSFVAKAELDGFQVVPPVLASKTGEACLEFKTEVKTQESTAATGEVVAEVLAGRPGTSTRQPLQEITSTDNIRLYFGQHFANGRPIATLCDVAIRNVACAQSPITTDDNGFDIFFFDFSRFRLSDIQFQGQQLAGLPSFFVTIPGIDADPFPDTCTLENDRPCRVIVPDNSSGLKLMKFLIKQGLIYVVVQSKFEAIKRSGEIIRYKPRRGVIDVGDGEIRGTLRLAPKGSRCPPPPEPAPDE